MKRRIATLVGLLACVAALAVVASPADDASAAAPIIDFSLTPSTTQAGAHPDIITDMDLMNQSQQAPVDCQCNILKEFTISSPPGLVGSPTTTPRCTQAQFGAFRCPSDTQIGITVLSIGSTADANGQYWLQPLYNMVPRPDELALWATYTPYIALPSIFTSISTRTDSDYGLDLRTVGIPLLGTPPELTIITWGVPAEPAHDDLRWPPDQPISWEYTLGCNQEFGSPLPDILEGVYPDEKCYPGQRPWGKIPSNLPPVPYFSNPTTCGVPLSATLETLAYDLQPARATTDFPTISGCDQLGFDPSLSGKPTTTGADSPSGIDIDIKVPQTASPATASPSQVRGVTINLPDGFTINPNAADGKTACTDVQARFGTREEAQCPEFAKIGTLEIESAALPRVLPGALYIGEPLPGNRYRVVLTADGFSVHVKLPGTVSPDPKTGQLRLAFENLPQTPFERFNLHVFGAERGLLATPTQCGTYPVKTEFVPWAAELPTQNSTQFFQIETGPGGAPCPAATRSFSPRVNAGIDDSTGGHHSTFVFDVSREDGQQELAAADIKLPPGLTASLKGIPYCPEATLSALAQSSYAGLTEVASPACAASRVGRSVTSAGAGSRPVSLPGTVYLGGPYAGSPLSLAIVTPAVSGPYDLGNVVVRVALAVDPVSAQVTAVSDPIPHILEGIPLRLRRVMVVLDRPNFVLNPTNCDPFAVNSSISGDQGGRGELSTPFQVANCGALEFKPNLDLKLRGSVKRRGHPSIHATLTARPGDANIRRVQVTLPKDELLDQAHIRTVCTRVDFRKRACPEGSRIGKARVTTPLLDEPLPGVVYMRSSSNRLPDLVVDLHGQFDIEVAGRIDSVHGRLRTDFETAPDVPITKFELDLEGGSKGLLINSKDLCATPKKAKLVMASHSGRRLQTALPLDTKCGKAARKKARR